MIARSSRWSLSPAASLQAAAIKKFGARLGELETLGRFAHRDGEPVRYDFAERKIVGDRDDDDRGAVRAGRAHRRHVSERLERAVP